MNAAILDNIIEKKRKEGRKRGFNEVGGANRKVNPWP